MFHVYLSKQGSSLAAAIFRNLKSNVFLFLSQAYDFSKTTSKKKKIAAQLLILKGLDFNIKHCPGINGKLIIDPKSLIFTFSSYEINLKVSRGVALQYSEVGDSLMQLT